MATPDRRGLHHPIDMSEAHRSARASSRPFALLVFAVAVALQLPLILNPGYYSHDELQWAAFAQAGQHVAWLDVAAFQYRPLTFKLWMALSRALFDTPMAFHAVVVAWGSANAALLCALGRGFGVHPRPAVLGALAFVLSPYATYTHGWVGCIADLVWVSCALLLALAVQANERMSIATLAAGALTAIALLGKEAAFAMPPLLAVAWWFDGRKPKWFAAMLASGVVAALYLWLRLDVLLHAPREGTQYLVDPRNMPMRWFEYQVFPPIVPLLEAFTVLRRPLPVLVAALLWLGMLAAMRKASPRLAALFLLGGVAALLPALPLGSSWNHYGYAFAALASMAIAAAWAGTSRAGRVAIGLFAALSLLHGGYVMARMQQVGRIQSVFSPALARAVHVAQEGHAVTLRLAPGSKDWIFQRLGHAVQQYDGVEIGDRVRIVATGAEADYEILPDGRLRPLR